MKETRRCPKCEKRRIWLIDPVSIPHDNQREVMRLPVAAAVLSAMLQPDQSDVQKSEVYWAGDFEAYVCDGCGYTEFYARRLDKLHLLDQHTEVVTLIDESARSEYRS